MTCPYEKWLSQYIDEELPPEKSDRIRDHLDGCDTCRKEYQILAGLDVQLRSLPEIEPSDGFERAFWKKAADWEERGARRGFRSFFMKGWRTVVAGALATMMMVVGIQLFNRVSSAPSPEEIIMAEQMDLLLEYDIIRHLEMLENWEAVALVGEPS